MSGAAIWVLAAAGCACGGTSVGASVALRALHVEKARRREVAYGAQVVRARKIAGSSRYSAWTMRYLESLTRRMLTGATAPLALSARGKRLESTRTGKWFAAQSLAAGCSKEVNAAAFSEARMRLALIGALVGLLLGLFITVELAVLLGLAGAFAGFSAPGRAVRMLRRERGASAERHLSEMLEVVALGLRSGLTFDHSFALYGSHFDNDFAKSCMRAHRRWSLGLATRDECLRDLARSYDCEQLKHVVDSIVRSLRFGSALTGVLEDAAVQARASYRTALEERIAKAPVKMMLPTGALILPAMLLLVMGPVLLELMGGF